MFSVAGADLQETFALMKRGLSKLRAAGWVTSTERPLTRTRGASICRPAPDPFCRANYRQSLLLAVTQSLLFASECRKKLPPAEAPKVTGGPTNNGRNRVAR